MDTSEVGMRADSAPIETCDAGAGGFTGFSLDPRWEESLVADVQQLARWLRVRGRADRPVISVQVDDGAPEHIHALAERVAALRFTDLLPADEPAAPALAQIEQFVAGLDERELAIVRDRFVAWEPATLAELGARFNVTRERIRQIEKAVLTRFQEHTADDTAIGMRLAALRIEIDPISPLDRLIDTHPVLAREGTGLGVPLWRVLDQLDDAFEVQDGWAAMNTVAQARIRTRQLFDEVADEYGVALFDEVLPVLGMSAQETVAWLADGDFRIHDKHVLAPTRSSVQYAVQVIAAAGEPLHIDEIFARMAIDRSVRSIGNGLGVDDRVARVGRGVYGLAEWSDEEYTSIADMIDKRVREHGSYPITALIEEITPFGVAESSVRSFASYGKFETVNGIVTRRENPGAPVRQPAESAGMFRHGEGWALLTTLTRDHLRGSGFPVPTGVVPMLGLSWDEERLLPSAVGDQAVRWRAQQPTLGTIRRLVEHHGGAEGDRVLLVFTDDGRFDYRPAAAVRTDAGPLHTALSLTGSDPVDTDAEALAGLAAAVDMVGETRPRRILSAYRRKHDADIVEQLEKAWL